MNKLVELIKRLGRGNILSYTWKARERQDEDPGGAGYFGRSDQPGEYVICLGAGRHQRPLIERARQMGYRVVAVDQNPLAPGFEIADIKLHCSLLKPGQIYRMLREHLSEGPGAGDHMQVSWRGDDQRRPAGPSF